MSSNPCNYIDYGG